MTDSSAVDWGVNMRFERKGGFPSSLTSYRQVRKDWFEWKGAMDAIFFLL